MVLTKKLIGFATINVLCLSTLVVGIIVSQSSNDKVKVVKGSGETYSLTLDNNHKLHGGSSSTGSKKIATSDGNDITFSYKNVSGNDASIWQTLTNTDAYIKNTSPIHGLSNISIEVSSDVSFSISYGYGESNILGSYSLSGSTSYSYDFNHLNPNYFSINNASSSLSIVTMTLTYACSNEYYGQSIMNVDDNHMTYGMYPTSKVTNSDIISSLNDLYVDNPYVTYNSDNYYYLESKNSWFNVEPILWKYVSQDETSITYISEYILEMSIYDIDSISSYSDSDIKAKLNNEFINAAFRLSQSALLTFDNGDKVTLPSSNSGQAQNSEFAKDSGVNTSSPTPYGRYWLASFQSANKPHYVNNAGTQVYASGCSTTGIGIRPLIKISK